MSINLDKETLYPLRDIVPFVPRSTRTGRAIHKSVPYRWAKQGLKADDGTRVKLEVVKAGGTLATSREALHRFFSELTRRASLPDESASLPTDRRCQISNVREELDKSGF